MFSLEMSWKREFVEIDSCRVNFIWNCEIVSVLSRSTAEILEMSTSEAEKGNCLNSDDTQPQISSTNSLWVI